MTAPAKARPRPSSSKRRRRAPRPSWEAYAAASDGDHFAEFCAGYLVHSVDDFDGRPFELEPWEADHMAEALAVDEDGAPCWRSVALVLPRKNGKTTLLGAYALYRLLFDHGQPEILLAASSDKQAGRLFNAAVQFVRRSPWLAERLTIRDYIGELARKDGGGIIYRMSSDPERLHGYNPSLVVVDELAQWRAPRLRSAFAALTTGGGARSRSQVFTITTAGKAGERDSSILGQLVDRNELAGDVTVTGKLTTSRNTAAQTLVLNYCAGTADPADLEAIRAANPASWITDEYLARQAANPELDPADFLQLHGCVWAAGDTHWIARDLWRSLVNVRGELAEGDAIALGFDGSMFDDSTALVACRLDDGLLSPIRVWERPEDAAEWAVPRNEVDAAVAHAFEDYDVVRLYADPPYWQSEVDGWAREFGGAVHEWHTSRERAMGGALERFRTDARKGELRHDGSPVLARHVDNARTAESRSGYRIEKSARRAKIDCAVAAVLAYEARADALAAGDRRRRSRSLLFA